MGDVVCNVLAEGVRQVLRQALDWLGAGHQGLGGEANESNLQRYELGILTLILVTTRRQCGAGC